MIAAVLLFDVVALVGGKVHPMSSGSAALEATVVIDGDRIIAVAPDAQIPAGARRVELHGMHVIPGLIDGYAFHDVEHDLLYAAAGVTLICDPCNDLGRIFEQRERAVRDAAVGPLLRIAGTTFEGEQPSTDLSLSARKPEEVRAMLERLTEEKIDFVSFQPSLSVECWKELCLRAQEKHLDVWGQRLAGVTLEDALAAGQRHFLGLDALLPKQLPLDQIELAEFDPLIRRLAEAKGALVPALRSFAMRLEEPGEQPPELAILGPQFASYWQTELQARRSSMTKEMRAREGVIVGKQHRLLEALHRAGVALVPGSGAPHPWCMPGAGLVRELVEWQSSGIPAAACLEYATSRAARTLAVDDERGTLEPGKLADLVVLRSDPTLDIGALDAVETVVLRGRVLERAQLDGLLAQHRAAVDELKRRLAEPIAVEAPELPEGVVLLSGRVETGSSAGRLGAERWAVVREIDATLTFCGRCRWLGPQGSDRFVEVRQRVRKDVLDSFEIKVSTGKNELVLSGMKVAGAWRVKRTANQQFVDIQGARETLAAIDCGSVTTMLVLAQTARPGALFIAQIHEGVELEVVRWEVALEKNGDHKFATPSGWRLASFEPNGALKVVWEQVGKSGGLQTANMELDLHGGAGLPMSEAKLQLLRDLPEPPADPKK